MSPAFWLLLPNPREREAQRGEANASRSPRQEWQRRFQILIHTTKRLSSCHDLFYSTSRGPGATSPQTVQDPLGLCLLFVSTGFPSHGSTVIDAAAVRRATNLQLVSKAVPPLGPGFLFQAESKDMCHTFSRSSLTPRSCHWAKDCSTIPFVYSIFPGLFCFVLFLL